jgi:hypothetical protein
LYSVSVAASVQRKRLADAVDQVRVDQGPHEPQQSRRHSERLLECIRLVRDLAGFGDQRLPELPLALRHGFGPPCRPCRDDLRNVTGLLTNTASRQAECWTFGNIDLMPPGSIGLEARRTSSIRRLSPLDSQFPHIGRHDRLCGMPVLRGSPSGPFLGHFIFLRLYRIKFEPLD